MVEWVKKIGQAKILSEFFFFFFWGGYFFADGGPKVWI